MRRISFIHGLARTLNLVEVPPLIILVVHSRGKWSLPFSVNLTSTEIVISRKQSHRANYIQYTYRAVLPSGKRTYKGKIFGSSWLHMHAMSSIHIFFLKEKVPCEKYSKYNIISAFASHSLSEIQNHRKQSNTQNHFHRMWGGITVLIISIKQKTPRLFLW